MICVLTKSLSLGKITQWRPLCLTLLLTMGWTDHSLTGIINMLWLLFFSHFMTAKCTLSCYFQTLSVAWILLGSFCSDRALWCSAFGFRDWVLRLKSQHPLNHSKNTSGSLLLIDHCETQKPGNTGILAMRCELETLSHLTRVSHIIGSALDKDGKTLVLKTNSRVILQMKEKIRWRMARVAKTRACSLC